jgi:DNA-binding MarR family transcriptional regulator
MEHISSPHNPLADRDMTADEPAKLADKTPLGMLLSVMTSYEVLQRYLELELGRSGATPSQFHVMNTLFKNGGEMTPSNISKWVFRANNTISSVINTLERKGHVRKEPSKHDGRSFNVVITDEGWKKANQLSPVAQEISREVLSCLDKEEIEALMAMMRKIRNSLLPKINSWQENNDKGY